MLDSQINIMIAQNNKVKEQQFEYQTVYGKRHFDLDKEMKDLNNQRAIAENDYRVHETEHIRESSDQYNNKMYLIKDKTFDDLAVYRHKLEIELNAALIEDKEKRIQKFTEDRNAVKAQI